MAWPLRGNEEFWIVCALRANSKCEIGNAKLQKAGALTPGCFFFSFVALWLRVRYPVYLLRRNW